MQTVELQAMGCSGRAVLLADGPAARDALRGLPGWLAARERILSRFDPESELARLNARGGTDRASEVLWAALEVALAAASETDGLVTPTVLPALLVAGYDRPFDEMRRGDGEDGEGGPRGDAAGAPRRPAPDVRAIERDATTRSIRLPPGVLLDLGGTAKGWTADVAAAHLGRVAPALVDLGGDIAVAGSAPEPWPIAVDDPRRGRAAPGSAASSASLREPRAPEHEVDLDLVLLASGGVATSGTDHRRWWRGGRERHHLIDPRTGAPASSDVRTVTVIGPSALAAEIAAKRVLLAGASAGLAWLETRPELAGVVVRCDAEAIPPGPPKAGGGWQTIRSRRFHARVWKESA